MISIGIILLFLIIIILSALLFRIQRSLAGMFGYALVRGLIQLTLFASLLIIIEKMQNTLSTFLLLFLILVWASLEGGIRLWLKIKPMEKQNSIPIFSFIGIQFITYLIIFIVLFPIFYFFIFSAKLSQSLFWVAIMGQILFMGVFLSISSGKFFLDNYLINQEKIETALGLGLSIRNSFHWLVIESMRHGLMPFVFFLTILGSGNLPGFMSGLLITNLPISTSLIWQISLLLSMVAAGLGGSMLTLFLLYYLLKQSLLPSPQIKRKR